jgi:hypothetical protein
MACSSASLQFLPSTTPYNHITFKATLSLRLFSHQSSLFLQFYHLKYSVTQLVKACIPLQAPNTMRIMMMDLMRIDVL